MVSPGYVTRRIIGLLGSFFGIVRSGTTLTVGANPPITTVSIPATFSSVAPLNVTNGSTTTYESLSSTGDKLVSGGQFGWVSSATDATGSLVTGLARNAAGQVNVTNGSSTTYLTLGQAGGALGDVGLLKSKGSNNLLIGTDASSGNAVIQFAIDHGTTTYYVMQIGTGGSGAKPIAIRSTSQLAWTTGEAYDPKDTGLARNAAGIVDVTNGSTTTYATIGSNVATFCKNNAIPAAGSLNTGITATSTANFGVFFGSGAPTLSAAKGSLYLRSDGSGTNDRLYSASDGAGTWTPIVTVG